MAECPHPADFLIDFRDWNESIGAYEVGAECSICRDVVSCWEEEA